MNVYLETLQHLPLKKKAMLGLYSKIKLGRRKWRILEAHISQHCCPNIEKHPSIKTMLSLLEILFIFLNTKNEIQRTI